jgi:hypothetical protein
MKGKIILAIALLIGLSVTSADAQSVREKRFNKKERISGDFRQGKLSKSDRYHPGKERSHYRKHNFRGRKQGHFSHGSRRHFKHDGRKPGRHGYSYRKHRHSRFD